MNDFDDFEIIQQLLEVGPSFLKNIKNSGIRIKYEKLYLDEPDIFTENNLKTYITLLLTNDNSSYLWTDFIDSQDTTTKIYYLNSNLETGISPIKKLCQVFFGTIFSVLADSPHPVSNRLSREMK
jgi:hypothetical protein